MGVHGILSTRNSVDTEFRRNGIPLTQNFSTRNSVDNGIPSTTEFRRQRKSVDTEFPRRHGIPSSTQNSPVDTELPYGHGILSTQNSVNTEFRRHGIPPTRNSAYFFLLPYISYAMLFIFVPYTEFRGILPI